MKVVLCRKTTSSKMNNSCWFTPKDVLKDLADVTGIRSSDEGFILRGQRPPPPLCMDDEDDEMELRFGGTGDQVASSASVKPDLAGITNMLRMVDKLEEKEEKIDSCDSPHVKIVITKLNPDVKEFIPRRADSPSSSKLETISKYINMNGPNYDRSLEDKANTDATLNEKTTDTLNASKLVKKLKIEALLKEKIKDTANASTMKEKRDRNVALMNLMNLNCRPPPTGSPTRTLPKSNTPLHSSGSNSPTPILIPPEYFENAPCSTNHGKHLTFQSLEHESKSTSILKNYLNTKDNVKSADNVSVDVTSGGDVNTDVGSRANISTSAVVSTDVRLDSSLEPRVDNDLSKKVLDPHVKESIEKVNKWLDVDKVEEKKTLPVPHLGTIVYRKKESKKPEPPPEIAKPSNSTPAFVPSQYASDLAKKYEERSKTKIVQAQDMWTKLENDLKAKDEEIKKRATEQDADKTASGSGCSGRSSSTRKHHK